MAERYGFIVVLSIFSLVALAADAQAEDWKTTLSATYETGTYGTGTRIDTEYIPLTVKRYFDNTGDLSLTVPYISQTSNGQVTFINGLVFRTNGAKKAVTTESGLGDMIGEGRLYVMEESQTHLFDLSVVGRIKFPTADKSKGLGTGAFDETGGLELSRSIVPDWTGFFDVYYTFIGSVAGLDLKNTTAFDFGASYKTSPETTVSLFYSQSTPIVSGIEDLRDLLANGEYRLSNAMSLFAGVDIGLSTSSPDIGITGGISYRF